MADNLELPNGIPPSPEALWLYVNLTNVMRDNYASKESVEALQKDVDTIVTDRKSWVRASVIVMFTGAVGIAATFIEALVLKK